MKILISDPISKEAVDMLKNAGFEVDERVEKKTPEELAEMIGPYHAVVVRSATKVKKVAIDKAPNLKIIARGGVGVDNIDVEYAKEKGIQVINTPAASSRSVAELAMGYMFALARFIPQATISMKKGEWEKNAFSKGIELGGKTLGIIGIGRIGKELAKMALGIGMNVIAYDPYVEKIDLENVKLVSKDELLANSDIISLHIPYVESEGACITEKEFNKMKKGVILINCARGGVVDEKALLDALNNGIVRFAGIDVFAEEPTKNFELVNHPNVAATPHIGASTVEGQYRVGIELAEKLIELLK